MRTTSVLISFIALVAPALATRVAKVTYDTIYDMPATPLTAVACSNGKNGLLTKGFTTFGSLPTTNIGGMAGIVFNSTECGSCWELSYEGKSVNVLAIDFAGDGFNVAESTLNILTDGNAVDLGHIEAEVKPADASACGL